MNVSEEQLHLEAKEMGKFGMLAKEQFYQGNYFAAIDFFTKSINASQYVFEQSNYVNRGTAYVATGQYQNAAGNPLTVGTLETSNVDMATEMTNLTQIQRAYQFNSKALTTSDQMMGIVTSLK